MIHLKIDHSVKYISLDTDTLWIKKNIFGSPSPGHNCGWVKVWVEPSACYKNTCLAVDWWMDEGSNAVRLADWSIFLSVCQQKVAEISSKANNQKECYKMNSDW